MSNPVGSVDPEGLDSWGLLPPNYQPIPNFPQVPTVGQVFSQTVGGWASDAGGFFGSIGHSISYGAQGLWDLTTGNQQFMNALSPHDQPMPAYDELKNLEQQMKSARGCPTYLNNLGRQIAQAEEALQLEQAANAENAAALQAGVNNLLNSEQRTETGLTGLAIGTVFGDIPYLAGLTDAAASAGFAGQAVAGMASAAWGFGGGLLGSQIGSGVFGGQPGVGTPDAIGAGGSLIDPYADPYFEP